MGAEEIVACVEKKLGVGLGQTTADKKFTLSEVECLGSCGTAPVAQINDDYYENLTQDEVVRLLDQFAAQE
jgi:NADH:ubiquinone oxidoreductase subunit E